MGGELGNETYYYIDVLVEFSAQFLVSTKLHLD